MEKSGASKAHGRGHQPGGSQGAPLDGHTLATDVGRQGTAVAAWLNTPSPQLVVEHLGNVAERAGGQPEATSVQEVLREILRNLVVL